MVESIDVRHEMPDLSVAPTLLYEDSWAEVAIERIKNYNTWLNPVTVSSHWDIDPPGHLSDHLEQFPDVATSDDTAEQKIRPELKNKLSDTQLDFYLNLVNALGVGSGADLVTPASATDYVPSGTKESKNNTRKWLKKFREEDLASIQGKDKSGAKKHRLEESPYAATDGGYVTYDLDKNWETIIWNLAERDDVFLTSGRNEIQIFDWFAGKNQDDLVRLFELCQTLSETAVSIRDKRTTLDEKWNMYDSYPPLRRKRYIKPIREHTKRMRRALKQIFDLIGQLVSKVFRSAEKWALLVKRDDSLTDNPFSEKHLHPNAIREQCSEKLQAKEFALDKTHIGPLLKLNPKKYQSDDNYTDYVHELEKNIGYLVEWLWEIATDLVPDPRAPAPEESEEPDDSGEVDTVTSTQDVPPGYEGPADPEWELTQQEEFKMDSVQQSLEDTAGPWGLKSQLGLKWADWVTELNEVSNGTYSDQEAAQLIEQFHEIGLHSDDWDHEGVAVWDDANETNDPVYKIKIVYPDTGPSDFGTHRESEWHQNARIELPPLGY
jgi:hypothetical protein